jgi:PAS domain-containing protein
MRSLNSIYPAPEAGVNRIFAVIEDITELKSVYSRMNTLLTRLPIAIGVYFVDGEPKICRENQQMTALLTTPESEAALADGHTAPTEDRTPALRSRADLLAHLARRYRDDVTELDETVRFIGSRGATQLHLLGALSAQDGRVECYCALVPMPDDA